MISLVASSSFVSPPRAKTVVSKRIKLCLNLMRESLEGNKTELVTVSKSLSIDKVVVVVVVVVVAVVVVVDVVLFAVNEVVLVVFALVAEVVATAKISSGSID